MLAAFPRVVSFFVVAALSGCINLSDDNPYNIPDYKGCSLASPRTVADQIAPRYALGSTTTLYLDDMINPRVTSSDPDTVYVGPVEVVPAEEEGRSPERKVELAFVGVGSALISVTESSEDPAASATVEVAPFERFEVVLPMAFDRDPVVPLAGRAVIDPAFEVIYFDRDGRLHGRGLAQSDWSTKASGTTDAFFNDELDSGPHQVEVQAGNGSSVILFRAVAPREVVDLELLETKLDENRVRVQLVGLTASGTQVWNIQPVFTLSDAGFYVGSFDYVHDPDARPTSLRADAWSMSLRSKLTAVEASIRGEPTRESDNIFDLTFDSAAVAGSGPVAGLISLFLMVLALRARQLS